MTRGIGLLESNKLACKKLQDACEKRIRHLLADGCNKFVRNYIGVVVMIPKWSGTVHRWKDVNLRKNRAQINTC